MQSNSNSYSLKETLNSTNQQLEQSISDLQNNEENKKVKSKGDEINIKNVEKKDKVKDKGFEIKVEKVANLNEQNEKNDKENYKRDESVGICKPSKDYSEMWKDYKELVYKQAAIRFILLKQYKEVVQPTLAKIEANKHNYGNALKEKADEFLKLFVKLREVRRAFDADLTSMMDILKVVSLESLEKAEQKIKELKPIYYDMIRMSKTLEEMAKKFY